MDLSTRLMNVPHLTEQDCMDAFDDQETKRDAWKYVRDLQRGEELLVALMAKADTPGDQRAIRAARAAVARERKQAHEAAKDLSDME